MTPAEINDEVLDMARDMRREDWEDSEPDVAEACEHLDIPVIDIVWTAAWNAAVDACATGGQGTAAERIAELEAELARINDTLRANGYEYPLGARGVEDMAHHRAEQLDELVRLDPQHWAAPGSAAGPYGARVAALEERITALDNALHAYAPDHDLLREG